MNTLAHNSLPHNLTEVCNAIIAAIEKGSKLTVDELMEHIKGPDFPLGNIVINQKDIKSAFATGHSSTSLKVRGEYEIKKDEIIFTTIPYRTYRNKIKEQINKNIDILSEYIVDFNDESNVGKNRLVFKVKKGVNPESAVLKLFALTDLQTTLSYNMNYIVDGTPKMCSMMELVDAYIAHQTNVLIASTNYDLEKAAARKHILDGLLLVISNIDKAIDLIRSSKDKVEAAEKLTKEFSIDEVQAKAVLDMKLARLTKLDKNDLIKELEEKEFIIAECDKILNDKVYRNAKLIEKVKTLRDKYGDARRTILTNIEVPKEEKEIEEVIPEDCVVVMSTTGYVKRVPVSSFRVQKRNGKGAKTADDTILSTISTNTIDNLMVFTDSGKMYKILVDDIPAATNTAKGTHISMFTSIDANEQIRAITSLHRGTKAEYVVFFTKNGLVKKSRISEYTGAKKKTGIQAIKLKDGDGVANITFLNEEDVMIITKKGQSIKFETKDITATGRVSCGVKGIKLKEGDSVLIGLPIHKQSDKLAVFSTNGVGKKVDLSLFPLQGRGGTGVKVGNYDEVAGAAMICDEDNILILGRPNSICISGADIDSAAREALGVKIIKDSVITSVVKL